MHCSINTAWSFGPVPLLQQDVGNGKAQTRLRFHCTHSQESLPRAIKYVAVLDRSCSPGTHGHRGSISSLSLAAPKLLHALARSSAVSTGSYGAKCPKPGNPTKRRREAACTEHAGAASIACISEFLCSCCQHQVLCPNITPSSAVATTASKPIQPAANVCKKVTFKGEKFHFFPV